MTQPAAQPTSGWTITGQRETQQLLPGSQAFVKGVDVTFTTGNNVTSSVFVPYQQYNAATVAALINERAAQLDSVSNLAAPPASN